MIQALEDSYAVNVSGDGYSAVILYGCKISVDHETNDVTIQTTSMGGEWYKDISQESHQIFLEKGWRIGVYELLEVNRDIQIAISEKKPLKEIEDIAVNKNNMLTLRKYGLELIKEGLTTFAELERVI